MSKQLWKLCNAYGPVFLWAGLIFVLSAQSSLPGFDVLFYDYLFKKGAHIFVYGVFYLLIYRAINFETLASSKNKNWLLPFALTFAYASLDELHQMFTPRRHPSPIDIGYDMLGASIVFLRIYRYI